MMQNSSLDSILRIGEVWSVDGRSGEKQFDYVAPSNREVQNEMEKTCTAHLKRVGAWLDGPLPDAPEPDTPARFVSAPGNTETVGNAPEQTGFPVTASVIIPVFNRVKTVGDAVRSALSQRCDFDFNVIVIDNHSTAGTTGLLQKLSADDPRLVHIIPPKSTIKPNTHRCISALPCIFALSLSFFKKEVQYLNHFL